MATGITGRLIRQTSKEPLQGITVEAINASTGVSGGSSTTNTQGFYEVSGLTSAVYFAKPLVSGDDWELQPNIAEIYTDEIHVNGAGALTIDQAPASPSTATNAIVITQTDSGTVSSSPDMTGLSITSTHAAAGAMGDLVGVDVNSTVNSLKTVTDLVGVRVNLNANGIQTNVYGVDISSFTSGGSLINAGLRIRGPAAAATAYAIYSDAGAKSYFAGAMEIAGALTIHGDASIAPTTWSPSYTNFTTTDSTVTARYERIGGRVFGHFSMVFGALTEITGTAGISTPVTASASLPTSAVAGNGFAFDSSTSTMYLLCVRLDTTGRFGFVWESANETVNATQPFDWDDNDQLFFSFQYEGA